MPRAHGHWTAITAFLLFVNAASAAPEDAPPQPDPGDRAGRVLEEWQARLASYATLDVRFTGEERRSGGVSQPLIGRVVLQPERAVVSLTRWNGEGIDAQTERFLWTKDALHVIRPELREHAVYSIAPDDQGRLPTVFALPFLWNTNVEALKRRYRVELLNEDAERYVLRIAPSTGRGLAPFSEAFLLLDRGTLLPRRYHVISPDGSSRDFRVSEPRINQWVGEGVFEVPDSEGWKVVRNDQGGIGTWLIGLFKPEMLP